MRIASEPERRTAPGTTAGVLDTIADAFSFIIERPRLMIVPLLVDIVIWLVLNVSVAPLADNIARFIETSGAADSDIAADGLRQLGGSIQASDSLSAFLPSVFSGIPLDTGVNILVTLLSPNMGFGIDRALIYDAWEQGLFGDWTPGSAGLIALIGFVCLIGGTLLLALYRVPLARAIRGDTNGGLLPEIGKAWIHFIGYLALMAFAGILALIPLFVASLVFLILGFNLIFVITMILFVFGGMASVYTLFMVDAMLLHRIGPIQAFSMSTQISRSYFGQVVRFAITSLLILLGALQLWSRMVESVPGLAIALIVNAFLGTAMTFASMLFYSDRFRQMQSQQASNRRS